MISLDVIVAGLAIGSIYGLLALGYHVTYVVSNTVNFSLGAILMLGAVLFYELHQHANINLWISVILVLMLCGLMGVIIERCFVRPFVKRAP
jgi:branched-chain amino acid transport system permease protein